MNVKVYLVAVSILNAVSITIALVNLYHVEAIFTWLPLLLFVAFVAVIVAIVETAKG